MELKDYFTRDLKPPQRQYEALRAVAFGEGTIEEIAKRFGYTPQSLRTLVNRLLTGRHQLFLDRRRGPKRRRTSAETINLIIDLRRSKRLSSRDITAELNRSGISIGVRTVERILADAGFPKLRRRTNRERGISKHREVLPARSSSLSVDTLEPFKAECKVAGVFFFLPYIIESGILDVFQRCALPSSSEISNIQAALSMLLLKLIGSERLSHIGRYNMDRGFGLFAGLNVLPKPSYICSYSCRTGAEVLLGFQRMIIETLSAYDSGLYNGQTINLDFHSIPHFGDDAAMEKVWCGSRGKAMKGANTFFAQDGESDAVIYSRADIKRSESSEEIRNFVDYWQGLRGVVKEKLVFDSKLTRYSILYDLDRNGVKFITLRKRGKKMIEEALHIPEDKWEKVYLQIPKRKHKHVKTYENMASLIRGEGKFRQITVKDHGRAEPTFIITNDMKMNSKDILTVYAKRWHIENKLSELVDFFNLNSLSSPIMIRIHFDILFTIIADTLYHIFARDTKRYKKAKAKTIFSKFIDMPGQIQYDGEKFTVKIRKRATTPLLLGIDKLNKEIKIPWLKNKPLKIIWTP